jgi:hypothetical protein
LRFEQVNSIFQKVTPQDSGDLPLPSPDKLQQSHELQITEEIIDSPTPPLSVPPSLTKKEKPKSKTRETMNTRSSSRLRVPTHKEPQNDADSDFLRYLITLSDDSLLDVFTHQTHGQLLPLVDHEIQSESHNQMEEFAEVFDFILSVALQYGSCKIETKTIKTKPQSFIVISGIPLIKWSQAVLDYVIRDSTNAEHCVWRMNRQVLIDISRLAMRVYRSLDLTVDYYIWMAELAFSLVKSKIANVHEKKKGPIATIEKALPNDHDNSVRNEGEYDDNDRNNLDQQKHLTSEEEVYGFFFEIYGHVVMKMGCGNGDVLMEFLIRFYWLQSQLFSVQHRIESALFSLNACKELIQTNEVSLPHLQQFSSHKLNLSVIQRYFSHLQFDDIIKDVDTLLAEKQYSSLISLLRPLLLPQLSLPSSVSTSSLSHSKVLSLGTFDRERLSGELRIHLVNCLWTAESERLTTIQEGNDKAGNDVTPKRRKKVWRSSRRKRSRKTAEEKERKRGEQENEEIDAINGLMKCSIEYLILLIFPIYENRHQPSLEFVMISFYFFFYF